MQSCYNSSCTYETLYKTTTHLPGYYHPSRSKVCSVCNTAASIWEVPGGSVRPETCYREWFFVVSLTRTWNILGLQAKLALDTSVCVVSTVRVGRPRNRGSISSRGMRLSSPYHPNRPCDPPNLLLNRYRRRFPVVQGTGD
jgi:hypothetical protein